MEFFSGVLLLFNRLGRLLPGRDVFFLQAHFGLFFLLFI